ncbi:uncharacterized protein LOC131288341 [Anopheles ziemanni]|uniref:uncharacterized protein LOC131258952 n=1 Tax=Anopheles coustani TaxID=139045 RepID=UPI00265A6238|nr:uncharacterized protein LOC131258952 [Anopheles coustani]XP_058173448.1 uncharacterized protein LOC131288341 [Anopheles ziemanni]
MACRMWIEGLNPFQADANTSLKEIDLCTLLGVETISSRMLVRFGPLYAFIALEKTLYTFSVVIDHRKTKTFDADIVSLAANSKHCLVLLSSGRLFRYNPLEDRLMPLEFLGVERVKDDQAIESITHLAGGECVTVACTSLNAVYNIPNKTVTMPKHVRIRKVVAGFEHCLLLTTNGDVYSWGGGLRGQLGNGEIVAPQDTPQLVEPLAGVKIVDIAADGWHSAAVSSFGDLYTWGWNNQGQLGLLDPKHDGHVVTQPQLVTFPDGAELTVERVHCGIGHTVVEATYVDGGTRDVLIAGWNLVARFDYQRPTHRPKFTGFRKLNLPDKAERSSLAVGAGANQIYFLHQAKAE